MSSCRWHGYHFYAYGHMQQNCKTKVLILSFIHSILKNVGKIRIFVIYGCLFTFSIVIVYIGVYSEQDMLNRRPSLFLRKENVYSTGFEDVMLKRYALLLRKSLCKKTYASLFDQICNYQICQMMKVVRYKRQLFISHAIKFKNTFNLTLHI